MVSMLISPEVHVTKISSGHTKQNEDARHYVLHGLRIQVGRRLLWNMRPGGSRPFWVKHKLVGLSCFFYLIPSAGYYSLSSRLSCNIHSPIAGLLCFVFALVALLSFTADYMHIPVMTVEEIHDWFENPEARLHKYPPSVWGRRDRILSLMAAIVAALECAIRVGILESLAALGIAFLSIHYSRNSSSQSSWIFRHTLWHVASSTVLFLMATYV